VLLYRRCPVPNNPSDSLIAADATPPGTVPGTPADRQNDRARSWDTDVDGQPLPNGRGPDLPPATGNGKVVPGDARSQSPPGSTIEEEAIPSERNTVPPAEHDASPPEERGKEAKPAESRAVSPGDDDDAAPSGAATWAPQPDAPTELGWDARADTRDGGTGTTPRAPGDGSGLPHSVTHNAAAPDEPGTLSGPADDSQCTEDGPHSGATFLPAAERSVEEVWGSSVEDVAPRQTLKQPGAGKLSLSHPPPTETAPPVPSLSSKGYELLAVLGEGGVGVVYQAVQKSVDREIAVKMIKPGMGRDSRERQKFVSEALVTGRLDHPNIVPIHDLDSTPDGQPFYTMKMVRGTPWGSVLETSSTEQNLDILLDVCDAVSFAHSRSVIHRDLKPDNVMLGEFGEVQVMDWGLGALVSEQGELVVTDASQAVGGTPCYMAPEMVTGADGPVGIHSDIYLLGAILFEIVTGKPPHPGRRVLDTLRNARANVLEPTDCGGVLLDIACKAMQTVPTDRYASVSEFKQALLDYRAHAESINLCMRSAGELQEAAAQQDYELFAKSLFGFREALELWQDNAAAQAGIVRAQLDYARCALAKGDLDLAGSTLDPNCPDHQELAREVREAQLRQQVARRRLRLFRRTVLGLTAAVIVILTVASAWIYSAKQQATAARDEALEAKEQAVAAGLAEARQREVAEAARSKAQEEEARAVQALADLEKAYSDLVEAQEQEKRAWAQAAASDRVAAETRDELAKTGMLLDNSWWVSDAAAARGAQAKAAGALGTPVELQVALGSGVELALVLVPPGEFVMGSPPEEEKRAADEHLHRVQHPRPYYLGKFELTEAQWLAAVGQPPPSAAGRDADAALPATGVPPEQIMEELLPALQRHAPAGYEFRLPSEAEWEYACRAGTPTAYHGGNGEEALTAVGWFLANSERKVQPVGGKVSNAFGLFDMHGNVGELCADRYLPGYYLESPVEAPLCTSESETLVVRGGSVLNLAEHCRSAYRSHIYNKNKYPFVGLRPALVPLAETPAAAPAGPTAPGASPP